MKTTVGLLWLCLLGGGAFACSDDGSAADAGAADGPRDGGSELAVDLASPDGDGASPAGGAAPRLEPRGPRLYVERDSSPADPLNQLELVASDADAAPQSLAWSVLAPASHGEATVAGGAPSSPGASVTIGYAPQAGYVGRDSFTIAVDDGRGNSAAVQVEVVVCAAVHWVDGDNPSSSDNGPGTADQPWATIGKAAATLAAGEAVLVRNGTYAEEVEPAASGVEGQPIVYAAAPGATVTLEGSGLGSSPEGFRLDGAISHVIIDGFRITGFDESIYVVTGPHQGLTFRNLLLQANERGLLLRDCQQVRVLDSVFRENNGEGFGALRCDDLTVERCLSQENDDGAGTAGDADGFHVELGDDVVFRECRALDNSEDGFDLTCNCELSRCEASGNGAVGLKAWRRDADGFAPKTHRLLSSLFHDNGEDGIKASEGAGLEVLGSVAAHNGEQGIRVKESARSAQVVMVKNTLIAWNGSAGLSVGSGSTADVDYNGYHQNGGDDSSEVEPNAQHGDPLVEDATVRDYRLTEGSPLRDRGVDLTAAGLLEDYVGVSRPQGGAFDIGAFEHVAP